MKGVIQNFPPEIRTATKVAANLPQTAQAAYFTVTGGKVAVKLYGEVTTVIQDQACNLEIYANPTSGTDTVIGAALEIRTDAVGTVYSLTGTTGDAILENAPGACLEEQNGWIIVPAGTIDLKTSASNTGATKWTCKWTVIDAGATLA